MNRLPWICARRKNVFEMSGRIDGPATGGQTPWRSDWRRHVQSTHACKRQTSTSSRGEASCGDAGAERGAHAADGKGDQLFIERDRELVEVRSQFAELQTLFDEVNHQLQKECRRIEGLQETVNACVTQSKELEAIHHKLEESHQMLTQMRDTRAWREDQDSEAPETRATACRHLT